MTIKKVLTRREREAAIDRSTEVDFPAAVLKGLVEHQDAASYFGSTGALLTWIMIAEKRGWITDTRVVTMEGRRHYDESGLEQLPKIRFRRAYFWNWSCYTAPTEPVPPPPPPEPPRSSDPQARAKPAKAAAANRRTPKAHRPS